MKQWDEIFKTSGKFFTNPQKDIPAVVKLFRKRDVKNILDLGCGSGRHLVYLAKHGFNVYGFDISEHGIRIAKDWLKEEKLNANLKIGSIYKKFPYRDNSFDAVICIQTIHHSRLKNIQKAIKEIERVLKPNGLLFVTVPKSKGKTYSKKNKLIEPRTYLPLEGREAGILHYIYTKDLLKKDFKNFKISKIWVDKGGHYCFIGELTKF